MTTDTKDLANIGKLSPDITLVPVPGTERITVDLKAYALRVLEVMKKAGLR